MVGTVSASGTSIRWVESTNGFIYAPHVQPVRNLPNTPVAAIPAGKPGFWAEVTVPYVDLKIQNQAIGPAIKFDQQTNSPIRLYYSQVVWIDQVGSLDGQNISSRFSESPGHGYGYGDLFLAAGP